MVATTTGRNLFTQNNRHVLRKFVDHIVPGRLHARPTSGLRRKRVCGFVQVPLVDAAQANRQRLASTTDGNRLALSRQCPRVCGHVASPSGFPPLAPTTKLRLIHRPIPDPRARTLHSHELPTLGHKARPHPAAKPNMDDKGVRCECVMVRRQQLTTTCDENCSTRETTTKTTATTPTTTLTSQRTRVRSTRSQSPPP